LPVISRFYGILIKIYFREHGVPHFHAIYNEHNGVFEIETLNIIEGDLPKKAKSLIIEWAKPYQKDLLEMWNTQNFKKLTGLE